MSNLTSNARSSITANKDAPKQQPSSSPPPPPIFHKQKSTTKRENNQSTATRSCSFRLLPAATTKGLSTPIKHLKYVGSKAVGVLKKMSPTPRRSSTKVTSSSYSSSERRANNVPDFLDTQRAEAINDCIEFINSSSSTTFSRSKSVSH